MDEGGASRTDGENGKQWAAGKNWILTKLVLDICFFHPNFVNIIGVEEHISRVVQPPSSFIRWFHNMFSSFYCRKKSGIIQFW